ncbi:MAG: hypothetical protein IPO90_13160 [Flavobacteriales bacterium]|nr:hypothetical protein [Flavobacteriales bacterium]
MREQHERYGGDTYHYTESGLGLPGWTEDHTTASFHTSETLLDRWMKAYVDDT